MKIVVNTRKVRLALLELLEVKDEDAPLPLINAVSHFYFNQLVAEAKRRDLLYAKFESVDDATALEFAVSDTGSQNQALQVLNDAATVAFEAAYNYAVKRVIRDGDADPSQYKER